MGTKKVRFTATCMGSYESSMQVPEEVCNKGNKAIAQYLCKHSDYFNRESEIEWLSDVEECVTADDIKSVESQRGPYDEVTFEILEHIGVIKTYDHSDNRWSKEVNVVSWNGGPPKVDIRDWSEDHERMTRGITLWQETAKKLEKGLLEYEKNENKYDFSSFEPEPIDNTEFSFQRLDHVTCLEERPDGWGKECNVVSWNGNTPKFDIRDWSPDYKRMGRGITLTEEDGYTLARLLEKWLPRDWSAGPWDPEPGR